MPWRLGRRRLFGPEGLVEGVAGAAHGPDRIGAAGTIDRLAQPADMHIDGALVDIDPGAPDAVEKLVAREYPARALHQELEQLELGRAEMKLAAAAAHPARLAVELDVARGEEMGDMRRLRPQNRSTWVACSGLSGLLWTRMKLAPVIGQACAPAWFVSEIP